MEQEETSFVLNAVASDPLEPDRRLAGRTGAISWSPWSMSTTPYGTRIGYLTNAYWSTTNLPWLINHASDCSSRATSGAAARG